MGCLQSSCDCEKNHLEDSSEESILSEINISKFKLMPYLGVGGSGLVRAAKKINGIDKNIGKII